MISYLLYQLGLDGEAQLMKSLKSNLFLILLRGGRVW